MGYDIEVDAAGGACQRRSGVKGALCAEVILKQFLLFNMY